MEAAGGGGGGGGGGGSTLAYNLVIGCLLRRDRAAEAETLLHSMHAAGVAPDTVCFSLMTSLEIEPRCGAVEVSPRPSRA